MDIFDEKSALEKSGGNAELMQELLAMLVTDLPGAIDALGQSLQQGDRQQQWDHAHKLKGSTAYCGAPALQAAATALEQAIKQQRPDIDTLFEEVQCEAGRLIDFYQQRFPSQQ